MLIAFTGKAGAGKDTAANCLIREHKFVRVAFAEALKKACMFKFGLSHADVFTEEGKKRFVPEWGRTVRRILQEEGTEATKPYWGNDFWVRRLVQDINALKEQGIENLVITDARFDEEISTLSELIEEPVRCVRIVRPERNALQGIESGHASEMGISDNLITKTIINDGDMPTLSSRVLDWYEGIKC